MVIEGVSEITFMQLIMHNANLFHEDKTCKHKLVKSTRFFFFGKTKLYLILDYNKHLCLPQEVIGIAINARLDASAKLNSFAEASRLWGKMSELEKLLNENA